MLQRSGQSRLSFFPAHRKAGLCTGSRQSCCSFNMALGCVTLDKCSLRNQVSSASRLDTLHQVLNRLLCIGLHFHSCITSGFQPLSHPFRNKTLNCHLSDQHHCLLDIRLTSQRQEETLMGVVSPFTLISASSHTILGSESTLWSWVTT